MKISSWNIQGIKQKQSVQELKLLIRIHKPDMIFLLETLTNEINMLKVLPFLGFDHFDFFLPNNHSGGIDVLWNDGNIHTSVLLKKPRALHMLVHDTINAQNSVVSMIYAPAQASHKLQFWERLGEIDTVIDSPWCLLGDFNEIEGPNEKRGPGFIS